MLAVKRTREGMDELSPAGCDTSRSRFPVESPSHKRSRSLHESQPAPSPFQGHANQPSCSLDLSAALRQRIDPQTGEVVFTLDQVRDIVRKAVEERERTLREQYDRILQTKLQEQFRAFAKFNEDYVSRQLRDGELSYCS